MSLHYKDYKLIADLKPVHVSSPIPVKNTPSPENAASENAGTLPRISSSLEKYGWFEEIDQITPSRPPNFQNQNEALAFEDEEQDINFNTDLFGNDDDNLELPLPLTEPPTYILEAPLTSQHLWYTTAGTRPQQPPEERKKLERIWLENFMTSSIDYPENVLASNTRSEERAENIQSLRMEFHEEVRGRGKGPFSNAVSKNFMNHCISCMTIQVPRYKVVRPLSESSGWSSNHTFHAQFLVVISLGSVPHGVWRRHSDFKDLYNKIYSLNNTQGPYHQLFKSTILSWQCVVSRQRWFRCLDKNYLSLKCFLIERFMQDLLFESPTPDIINEFLGFHSN